MSRIYLLGQASTISQPSHQALINRCGVVFAAKRFHALLSDFAGLVLPISPLPEALAAMRAHLDSGDIAVLASGDPLFFGIGKTLLAAFGKERLEIYPALSSMQQAFAKIKLPWQDARFFSLHGRDRSELLAEILPQAKVFLLTDLHNTPAAIAQDLQRQLATLGISEAALGIEAFVVENIGEPAEKVTGGTLAAIARGCFAELNVMIITRANCRVAPSCALGLTEAEIRHSRGLITKDEVRAAVLHKLKLPSQGVFWDLGAGSGSISLEAARLQPGLRIFAVERNQQEQQNILENLKRYELWQVRLIRGSAPQALAELPAPDRVFIGGSGGSLPQIIATTAAVLAADGIMVATAVTAATRAAAPRLMQQYGLAVELSTLQVDRTRLTEHGEERTHFNPITIVSGQRRLTAI